MHNAPSQIISDALSRLYVDVREREPKPTKTLFHYTDSNGLVGIVGSSKLRASGADFLNDSSEPKYALGVLTEVLEECRDKYKNTVADGWLDNIYFQYLAPIYAKEGPYVYVCCFSEHNDLLSQWRAYGKQCAGYALGFAGSTIYSNIRTAPARTIVKVVYARDEQENQARIVFAQIIDTALSTLGAETYVDVPTIKDLVRSAIFSEFYRMRAKFKHSSFAEEGEWRLVQFLSSGTDTMFRASTDRVIPFVELEIGTLPIVSVAYGASHASEYAEQSIRLLMRKYPACKIEKSTIPYRA